MIAPQQVTCSKCNETIPVNCVRCRFCGAFLREDMEEYYAKLQDGPRPVTYSDPRDDAQRDSDLQSDAR